MKTDLENQIKTLAKQSGNATTSHEAMQYAQAALNIAHIIVMLREPAEHKD